MDDVNDVTLVSEHAYLHVFVQSIYLCKWRVSLTHEDDITPAFCLLLHLGT